MKICQILEIAFVSVLVSIFIGCKNEYKQSVNQTNIGSLDHALLIKQPANIVTPDGMVWVEGKTLTQGANQTIKWQCLKKSQGIKLLLMFFL